MVHRVTENLYHSLMLDVWPGPAAIVDFGINSNSHLGALQHAVKHDDVTAEQLDSALGNGPKLTALITKTNPYYGVTFKTSWDYLADEDDCDELPQIAQNRRNDGRN